MKKDFLFKSKSTIIFLLNICINKRRKYCKHNVGNNKSICKKKMKINLYIFKKPLSKKKYIISGNLKNLIKNYLIKMPDSGEVIF